jgi:integrase
VRYIHRVFSLMLDLAVQDGRVARNAARGVRLPKLAKTEKRFLTHDQVRNLADAAGPYRLVVLLLAYCGLRWGELAALRVRRVDLMRCRLTVAEALTEVRGRLVWRTPKSHQVRSVPIPRFLVDELMAHLAGRDPDALVVLGPRGGVLRNLNFRRDHFDPAATAAGLNGMTPHELRHTAASLAVAAGANVKAVQRMLGHASAAMTLDVYAGLFDDDLDGVADRMDALGRAAAVAHTLPKAPVVDLASVRERAAGQ